MTALAITRTRLLNGTAMLVAVGMSFVFGYGLVRVATTLFGGDLAPIAVLAIPILPVVALAILADPRIGVLAVIATFPVGVSSVPALPIQLVQLIVLVVAVIVGLRGIAAGAGPLAWTPLMTWLGAFVAWMVIALPSALDQQLANREVVLWAVGLVTAALIAAACRSVSDVRLVLGFLVVVVVLAAISGLTGGQELRAAYGGSVVEGRATGFFSEPNQLGTFSATGALVAVGLMLGARTTRGRILAGAAGALCLGGLLLSLSRGSWIGFTLGVLVLLVKLREARRLLFALAVPFIGLAVVLGAFAPSRPEVEVVGERLRSITGERNPYDDRPAIWREAVREMGEDPLTGFGPGNFRVASTKATSKSRTAFAEHAHNLVMTWGAENGIPAAMLAIGVGVAAAARLRTLASAVGGPGRAMAAGLAAALTAVAGQGLVDYTLHNSVVFTTLMVLFGCVVALDRIERVDRRALA